MGCGLEAYRHDPDLELFDLMLSGAAHPSITQDQRSMLQVIEDLIKSCQEGQVQEETVRSSMRRTAMQSTSSRDYASRRVIRAALQAIFPDKAIERHNSLRRALHMTIQMLGEASKTPSPDCAYISDLFATTLDGCQTPFIEEIRRQHVYEVIGFTRELTQSCGGLDPDAMTESNEIMKHLVAYDVQSVSSTIEKLMKIACPESGVVVPTMDAMRRLRHGALLKPRRLWVHAEAKDVVRQLMNITSQEEQGEDPTDSLPLRRIRALKVIENPYEKMEAEVMSPNELEKAMPLERP